MPIEVNNETNDDRTNSNYNTEDYVLIREYAHQLNGENDEDSLVSNESNKDKYNLQ